MLSNMIDRALFADCRMLGEELWRAVASATSENGHLWPSGGRSLPTGEAKLCAATAGEILSPSARLFGRLPGRASPCISVGTPELRRRDDSRGQPLTETKFHALRLGIRPLLQ